jgi:hypothetical protein
MPTITITKLYDLVSIKLGKETAENLTTFIEEKIKCEVDTKTSILATKEDLAREIGGVKVEIGNCKTEVMKDAAKSKAEMIKWLFVFWVGQLAAMFGLIMLFIKK